RYRAQIDALINNAPLPEEMKSEQDKMVEGAKTPEEISKVMWSIVDLENPTYRDITKEIVTARTKALMINLGLTSSMELGDMDVINMIAKRLHNEYILNPAGASQLTPIQLRQLHNLLE